MIQLCSFQYYFVALRNLCNNSNYCFCIFKSWHYIRDEISDLRLVQCWCNPQVGSVYLLGITSLFCGNWRVLQNHRVLFNPPSKNNGHVKTASVFKSFLPVSLWNFIYKSGHVIKVHVLCFVPCIHLSIDQTATFYHLPFEFLSENIVHVPQGLSLPIAASVSHMTCINHFCSKLNTRHSLDFSRLFIGGQNVIV